jgi:hypothetical protein
MGNPDPGRPKVKNEEMSVEFSVGLKAALGALTFFVGL